MTGSKYNSVVRLADIRAIFPVLFRHAPSRNSTRFGGAIPVAGEDDGAFHAGRLVPARAK